MLDRLRSVLKLDVVVPGCADWRALLHVRERGRAEHSHPGFGPHVHSHIKLVATGQIEGNRTR